MPTVDPFGPVGLRPNKFRLSLWGCRTLEQLFLRLPAVRPDTVPTFVVYPFRVLLSPFLSGPSYHSSRSRPSSLLLPPCYSAACVLSIACSHWPTLAMRHIASQNERPQCSPSSRLLQSAFTYSRMTVVMPLSFRKHGISFLDVVEGMICFEAVST